MRDDPRAAGQEALLVDQLDQRLVVVARAERRHERLQDAGTSRSTKRPTPSDARRSAPRSEVRQELEGDDVEDAPGAGRRARTSRSSWRRTSAPPRARPSSPDEDDEQPALDRRCPGVSQRRRSGDAGSAGAGRSRPVELAMEDRRPARSPRSRSHVGELLGDGDRAVVAAGAADRDRQPGLALADVGRDGERRGSRAGSSRNSLGDRLAEDEVADRLGQARQLAQLRRCSTGSA